MTEAYCKACGSLLERDEIAIYRRIVYRSATEYLCIPCLAAEFSVSEDLIREKIAYLKKMGCTLFE